MHRLRSTEASRPPSPAIAKATREERRRGTWTALAGLVAATTGLALGVQSGLDGNDRPQLAAALLFLAGIALYGTGLHQVLWAPTADEDGVPRKVRPWVTALLCLVTWWVLATIAGLVAGVLKERALGG
jgi:drug/metabolite transporter (DMT)-like permease